MQIDPVATCEGCQFIQECGAWRGQRWHGPEGLRRMSLMENQTLNDVLPQVVAREFLRHEENPGAWRLQHVRCQIGGKILRRILQSGRIHADVRHFHAPPQRIKPVLAEILRFQLPARHHSARDEEDRPRQHTPKQARENQE